MKPAAGQEALGSFPSTPLWWPARAANLGGRVAEAALRRPVYSLRPADLLAEAMHAAQLTDLGPTWPDQAFTVLARSLDSEARLTAVGRRLAHRQLVRDARTRLRVVDALKRHPEVLDRPLRRPILMINLPRAGSTLLQFLLARAPEVRSLWPWEASDPAAAAEGSPDEIESVRRSTRRSYQMVRRLVPRYGDIHPMGSDEPEECNLLLARSFAALDLAAIYDVPSYADYLLASDLHSAYAEMRAQVQLMQGTEPPRSWVLRTPALLFATDAALAAFPDAIVIQLHRDPLVCLTSYCSLAATLRQANSEEVDPLALGPRWMELWAQGVERSMAARESAPATTTFLDFDYRDLIATPASVVERIRRTWSRIPSRCRMTFCRPGSTRARRVTRTDTNRNGSDWIGAR